MKGLLHKKRIDYIKLKTGLSVEEIENIINLFYKSIYLKLDNSRLSRLDSDLTEEEFNNKTDNVLIPRIGTFRPNYYKYKKINEKIKNKLK